MPVTSKMHYSQKKMLPWLHCTRFQLTYLIHIASSTASGEPPRFLQIYFCPLFFILCLKVVDFQSLKPVEVPKLIHSKFTGYTFLCCIALAFCTMQSLYPVILIVPICLYTYQSTGKRSYISALLPVVYLLGSLLFMLYISHTITGDWSFLDATFNFM